MLKKNLFIDLSYFHKFWIFGSPNLSVFYYEKAPNNGAESYHKTLKSYMKVPHPNIWKFMASLKNVMSDYDIESQRLMEGLDTTRGCNPFTKEKIDRRNIAKEKYLNGTFNELEYIDAIRFTIGRGDLETGSMSPQTTNTMEILFDLSTDDEDENCEKCHVCLMPSTENIGLLHEDFLHGGFCETCANRLLTIKAVCPICRGNIKCDLNVFL